ncbi:MAG: YfcE family phosphodiesterase [Saccharofermentans sp.]|nr:YfcE family phosphodiesterase [Saccharofermentans sp.]
MNRYLVCSDIHGQIENFKYALKEASMDGLDGVLIAGDTELEPSVLQDLVNETGAKLYLVRGNCDYAYGRNLRDFLTITLPGGIVCMLTHGHKYSVKSDVFTLVSVADNLGANLVIYGHTHSYDDSKIGSMRVVNPGALCGSFFSHPSYILMTIDGNRIEMLRRVIG